MDASGVRGLWCATLTPLTADDRVDVARLAGHVQRLFALGVEGVAPFGTTGEGPSFAADERQAALEGLLASGIPASRIVPSTGCADLPQTAALTRQAVALGCTACLVLPPFFFKDVVDEGVYAWYARLIERVADDRLRLILYNLPQVSDVTLSAAVVRRLDHAYPGTIAGVKDSAGDFAHTRALIDALPGRSIVVGHEPHLPDLMRAGGAGTICGVANLDPVLVRGLLRVDPLAETERSIRALLEILFRYPLVPAMKAMLAWQRRDDAWLAVRPPLVQLGEQDRRRLQAALAAAGYAPTA